MKKSAIDRQIAGKKASHEGSRRDTTFLPVPLEFSDWVVRVYSFVSPCDAREEKLQLNRCRGGNDVECLQIWQRLKSWRAMDG